MGIMVYSWLWYECVLWVGARISGFKSAQTRNPLNPKSPKPEIAKTLNPPRTPLNRKDSTSGVSEQPFCKGIFGVGFRVPLIKASFKASFKGVY